MIVLVDSERLATEEPVKKQRWLKQQARDGLFCNGLRGKVWKQGSRSRRLNPADEPTVDCDKVGAGARATEFVGRDRVQGLISSRIIVQVARELQETRHAD